MICLRLRTFGRARLLAAGLLLSPLTAQSPAQARAGGIAASSCQGCHGGSGSGKLTLAATPATISPGSRVELTLSIVGGYADGGAYITSGDVGTLEAIANQGLTRVSTGLVHNQPKPASGGNVQFRFAWTAPATPGAVRFTVAALGADGNGRSSGDSGLDGIFDYVYGCTGKTFYMDGDGDGFGRSDFAQLGCADAPPTGYVSATGDCDDYRKQVYPGAEELCNMIDDNCDGKVDDNAVPVELWPDADGDGYYDVRTERVGEPKIGCVGLKGFAAEPGDCKPGDASVHPGAEEICNNIDDDCDGDVDERVRPTCGEGWCRREAPGCDVKYCSPGEPVAEKCNFLDDDCDGLTDEDPNMCPVGQTCAGGSCVDSDEVPLDPIAGSDRGGRPSSVAGAAGMASAGTNAAATGGSPSSVPKDSSGCALGSRTTHGSLVVFASLLVASALRRRRRARQFSDSLFL